MATLTVQIIDRAADGLTPAYAAAAAGGDDFANSGREFLLIKTTTAACVVTATTPQQVSGLGVADETFSCPTTAERLIGPFPTATFNNPANGRVALTYSAVTGVTIGVFRVGA